MQQCRVALMNPFNALGTAEIERIALPQRGKGQSRLYAYFCNNALLIRARASPALSLRV